MNDLLNRTSAALHARVSSDRQDADLSVSAQLRALREHAERNGYRVVREYVERRRRGASPAGPSPVRCVNRQEGPMLPTRRSWSGGSLF